jgi:predicted MPP superfamily phosphohydrolase
MKIKLLSDLHMEGYKFTYEYAGEDVVVLAGDIHDRNRHHTLLNQIPKQIPILMVAGNHEYYGSEFNSVDEWLSNIHTEFPNFRYLQNESVKIKGIDFYGGTMFTDFRLYGETESWFAMMNAKEGIADFHWIMKNDRRWSPNDHVEEHENFREGLEKFLEEEHENRVVISHFMPSDKVANPKFAGSKLNPYFISNMERFMGWKGLWLCGHGHSSADVTIGDTRIVMNPRGYGDENVWGFNPSLVLEI